jgi:hypothetical protein
VSHLTGRLYQVVLKFVVRDDSSCVSGDLREMHFFSFHSYTIRIGQTICNYIYYNTSILSKRAVVYIAGAL